MSSVKVKFHTIRQHISLVFKNSLLKLPRTSYLFYSTNQTGYEDDKKCGKKQGFVVFFSLPAALLCRTVTHSHIFPGVISNLGCTAGSCQKPKFKETSTFHLSSCREEEMAYSHSVYTVDESQIMSKVNERFESSQKHGYNITRLSSWTESTPLPDVVNGSTLISKMPEKVSLESS